MRDAAMPSFVEEAEDQYKSAVSDINSLHDAYADRRNHYSQMADFHRRAAENYEKAYTVVEQMLNNDWCNNQMKPQSEHAESIRRVS